MGKYLAHMHTDTPTHAQHGFTYACLGRLTAVTSAPLAVVEGAAEEDEEACAACAGLDEADTFAAFALRVSAPAAAAAGVAAAAAAGRAEAPCQTGGPPCTRNGNDSEVTVIRDPALYVCVKEWKWGNT